MVCFRPAMNLFPEYYGHGTRPLIAALDTQTGEHLGEGTCSGSGEPFLAFLKEIVATQPRAGAGPGDSCDRRQALLPQDQAGESVRRSEPQFPHALHATYFSRLNQIELWFSKLERDVLARGIFIATADLKRKIFHLIANTTNAPSPTPRLTTTSADGPVPCRHSPLAIGMSLDSIHRVSLGRLRQSLAHHET